MYICCIFLELINNAKPKSHNKCSCNQRTVKKAYHVACKDCARKERCCAKCLQSAEQVDIVPAVPTPREEQRLKVEMDRLIKSLPERKRRTFVRFMKKGKETEDGAEAAAAVPETSDETGADDDALPVRRKRVPHSRADLLNKIEALRIAEDDENELGETDEENTDSDEYDYEYSDDLDSDDEEKEEVAAKAAVKKS